jgi:hypothetical protein
MAHSKKHSIGHSNPFVRGQRIMGLGGNANAF